MTAAWARATGRPRSPVTATVDGELRFSTPTAVTVSVAGSGAATAVDFAAVSSFDITIPARAASGTGTFTLTPTNDALDEVNETVTVSGVSGSLAVKSATISLTDNDATPTLSIDSPTLTEGDSGSTNLTFTVTLSAASARQVTVDYADAGTGSATSGTGTDTDRDYTAITAGTLTFTAGTTTQTFTVSVLGDALDEEDEETVIVTLSDAANATIATASGTGTIEDNDAAPTISIDSPSIPEEYAERDILDFTVSLSALSGKEVTVDVADAGTGTATSGTDYTATTRLTIIFVPGSKSQGFAIEVLDDTMDEADETVVMTLSNPTNATISSTAGSGAGTIEDDDDPPTLSIDSPTVTEGDDGDTTNVEYTVTLSAASGQTVTVDYAIDEDSTATSVTDYSATASGTLTFAAGTTLIATAIEVTGDVLDEVNETIVINLSNATNATIATGTGTVTITDDDGPTVSIDSPSVTEGDSGSTTLTFTVTLDEASVQPVTVDYADAGTGTATSGTDYEAITAGTLTFAVGTTSQTFDVSVTGDTTDEAGETVVVNLSNPTNATVSTTAGTGTGTITNDDGPMVSIDSPFVTEGDSGSTTLTFTATLSAASVQTVTVDYADAVDDPNVTNGTATSGTDYTAITGGTLTFPVGATSQTFDVSVTGDTTDETNETIVITLSNAANATIATATGTGTITNDDGATLSIDSPSVTEGDSGSTTLTFTVTLSAASGQEVTVDYADAGSGTATSGTDYTAITSGTLTFTAGTTSQTFDVSVTGDTTDEVDETVVVTLSNAANATISTAAGTGTITDNDAPPSLSIDSPSVTEGNSGSTATLTFTVTLSAASGKEVTVDYADATTGTATSGTDYTAITAGTLTFTAGTTSQTFDVSVTGDALYEANETVVVSLSSPTNATVSSEAGTGTGTITDDDAMPSITLTVDDSSVAEGDGATTITVTATVDGATLFGAATAVTVSVAGSGTASAVDFAAVTDFDITIAAGATSDTGSFTLTPMDDTLDEDDETVTVSGSGVSGSLTVNSATLSLTDDDDMPSLSIDSPSVAEGDSGSTNLTFTVTLSPVSGRQVTVAYADAGTGTATSGTDYTAITGGTLTFTAGTTSRTFNVAVTGDTTAEANETVAVTLSDATNATTATATGTGTITNDDDGLVFNPTALTVTEEGASQTFTVTLSSRPPSEQASISLYPDPGLELSAGSADTARNPGNVTFNFRWGFDSPRQITVTALADSNGQDETRYVRYSTSGYGAVDTTATTANPQIGVRVTVIDDDEPAVSLSLSPASVSENAGVSTVTATLQKAVTMATTITVSAAAGTDTDASDFTPSAANTLTIAAGETTSTGTVTITAVDNALDEPDKSVTVSGTVSHNGVTAPADQTLTITDDDPTPTLSLDSPSVTEGDSGSTTLTFTATLSAASGRQVTVDWADAGTGTATSGTDYTAITGGTLTFAAGTTSRTFDVAVTGDVLDEADETVVVTLSNAGNATIGTATGTGTITDDDDAPTLSVDSPSVDEGDSGTTNLTFTATLSAASGQRVTVDWAGAGGTATSGTDYTAITGGTLTFAAGTTSRTFDVAVTGDVLDEEDETVVATLDNAANATIATASGTGTITDDDATPSITLTVNDNSVGEGDGATTITVTATVDGTTRFGAATAVTVSVAGSGTATAVDFAAVTDFDIEIAAGAASQTGTFTLTPTDDTEDETDETITVSGASGSLTVNPATISLTDNDGMPTLSIDSPSVTEGDSGSENLTFTVRLSPASVQQVTVDWTEGTGGTATSGTDYTAITGGALTFAAGTTSRTFDVSVTGDTLAEPNETVVVTLSNAANATISTASGTGTITDDDAAPTLSIDSPSVTEGDSGSTTLTFTATLSAASGLQVTVDWAEGTGGTATSGTDYTAITGGTLTFTAGTTSRTFDVSVTGDTLAEADETVVVTLGSPTNATVSSTAGTGTGTITDNDAAPSLSIASASVTEGDSGSTNLTFTVTLSAASGQRVTVDWAEGTGGTATSGTDYTAITGGALTFAAGTTSRTFDVAVTGDTTDEADETVVVTLSNAGNATIGTASGTGTITDDDDAPTLSVDSPSVDEGDSGSENLTFTATLSAASGRRVTVDWAEGTGGTATSGTDYTAITGGTLTFAAGTTSRTFDVAVTGDTTDEEDETVVVTLSNAGNATIGTATGTGTITDDDDGPTLSVDSPSVDEGDSGSANLTFTATLSAASGRRVTVDWAEGTGGTATSGTDYTAITGGTLTFAAGTTSRTFDVAVTGDVLDEADETVVVTLSNAGNATIGTATGTGTITDDDDAPTLSVDSPSVNEGDSGSANLTFTATLSAASGRQVTVDWAEGAGGTATSGTDYTAITGGTLTFAAGTTSRTFDVAVTGDTTDEPNETVVVTLSNAGNATIGTASGTGTITDDDDAPTLSVDSPSVDEGDSGSANLTFTATLSAASGRRVTVDWAEGTGGTATSGTDYTAITGGALTFAAGTTSRTFDVAVTGDTLAEPNETVVVTLSNAGNATIRTATGTGTITNDDGQTLSVDSPSVNEGDSGSANLTFTATLSAANGQQVTVDWAEGTGGTATSGTDYTAITGGTLTFAAGTTIRTFDVSVTGDTTDEADETVVVTLSNAANATIRTATVTGTITDDDAAPGVVLSVAPSSISENGGESTVSATLTHPSSAVTTVTVTVAGGSGSYTVGSGAAGTIVIAAGETVNATDIATVTAVDNDVDAADSVVTVTGVAANAQAAAESAAINVTGAGLTITDDDTAALVVSPTPSTTARLRTTEDGGTDTFTVELGSEPTGNVVLAVVSSDTAEGTVSVSSLTFTATSWETAQTVTLTGVDDNPDDPADPADGDQDYTVTLTVNQPSTADTRYDALSAVKVYAVNADNDATADVNEDGRVDTADVLVMYYTYTSGRLLEADGAERLRRLVLQRLRVGDSDGATLTLPDTDTSYMTMLNNARDWENNRSAGGDVNEDGRVDTADVLVMYYTYTSGRLLEADGAERLRRLVLQRLRVGESVGATLTLPDNDTSYMTMLNNARDLSTSPPSP